MFPLASVIAAKLVLVLEEEEEVAVEEVAAASLDMEVKAPSAPVPRLEATAAEEEEVLSAAPVGGLGSRLLSHGWRSAWLGVIRSAGSHSRHCFRKSRNSGSSPPFSAAAASAAVCSLNECDHSHALILAGRSTPGVHAE